MKWNTKYEILRCEYKILNCVIWNTKYEILWYEIQNIKFCDTECKILNFEFYDMEYELWNFVIWNSKY